MNDTFSFRRFGTYFLYDLREVWKNNSKAFYIFLAAMVLFYFWTITMSSFYNQPFATAEQQWNAMEDLAPGSSSGDGLSCVIPAMKQKYSAR